MNILEPKPYKLIGKIQYYNWGTKGSNAYIPKFLGIDAEAGVPYAEYWIGVHPKAPSDILIGGKQIGLVDLLNQFPDEILGTRVAKKFNNTLPFLLKILSINQALSIQAHPDQALAKLLHSKDPVNYPDKNHKPEIAIAIDHLQAIIGLKNFEEFRNVIETNPELKQLFSEELNTKLKKADDIAKDNLIKKIYTQIINVSEDKLEKCIVELKNKFENKTKLEESEKQFLIQYKHYGTDIGLVSLLLFNLTELDEGEAVFTPAGIPHAYLKGNIVECMANSDNVVRVGLTPKFKDIKTLTEMLVVDSTKSKVEFEKTHNAITYKTTAEEFEVMKILAGADFEVHENTELNIILVVDGKITIMFDQTEEIFVPGDVVLIPAILKRYKIITTEALSVYLISVPL